MEIYFIGVLIFGASFLFLTSLHAMITGGDDSVKRRLEQLKKESAAMGGAAIPEWAKAVEEEQGKQRVDLKKLIGQVAGINFVEKVERSLARADMPMRVGEFMLMRVLLVIAPLGVCIGVLNQPAMGVIAAAVGFFAPGFYLNSRVKARAEKFNSQLAEFLILLVNALRAGQTFLQGVEHCLKESKDPIATEFRLLLQETALGLPVEAAFQNLMSRVPSPDLEITGTAFIIQKNVGGNLAEVMEKVAATIRERVKIQGQIKTLTAQGMLSGMLVGFLPVAMIVVFSVLKPDYIGILFTTDQGKTALAIGFFLEILGAFTIKKIITIEV